MHTRIEYSETDIMRLIVQDLSNKGIDCKQEEITVQVKSKQNYKSEWETAKYKAVYEKYI